MLKSLLPFFVIFLLSFAPSHAFDHDHKDFDVLLKKHVVFKGKQSLVYYQALKRDALKLDSYLASLSAVSKKEYNTFSKNDRLAFLINVYNAFTLKIILNYYPLKSIRDIGSFLSGNAWKKNFFKLFGKSMHLDFVEHKMIRKWFKEPRIHFAVNCASLGCPSLRRDAFVGSKLDKQLEESMIHFLSNQDKNNVEDEKLYMSKIFDWYEGDFEKATGSLLKFLTPYLEHIENDGKTRQAIQEGDYAIKFNRYDWTLNEVKDEK
jgi:hypothetical protein